MSRKTIIFIICLSILLMTSIGIPQSNNCRMDKRTYGNWQRQQQWNDYKKSQHYEDRTYRWHNQGRHDLEHNDRAWKRLYDNARESSRLYHEFHGPYNPYDHPKRYSADREDID